MNIFKKKSLCAALAGIGALGAVGAAQAVNLNPDGLGQVLIYPYYTTRTSPAGNVYNSLLSVVNSTASVKAVKVRFLEGKNSREVLDFNLFLSPKDVWTAGIVPMGVASPVTSARRGHHHGRQVLHAAPDPRRRQGVRQLRLHRATAPARRSTARRKATSKSSRWRRSTIPRTPRPTSRTSAAFPRVAATRPMRSPRRKHCRRV